MVKIGSTCSIIQNYRKIKIISLFNDSSAFLLTEISVEDKFKAKASQYGIEISNKAELILNSQVCIAE